MHKQRDRLEGEEYLVKLLLDLNKKLLDFRLNICEVWVLFKI